MTPDVNVLVAASRADHPHHAVARAWLEAALDASMAGAAFTLMPMVLVSFVRLVTSPKIFRLATPIEDAVAFADALLTSPGVQLALDRDTACRMFDMPPDREGDVAVVAHEHWCIGSAAKNHDLSGLEGHRLRTHGGLSEAKVPFILNRPLNEAYRLKCASQPLKSWQIFDYAINGTL